MLRRLRRIIRCELLMAGAMLAGCTGDRQERPPERGPGTLPAAEATVQPAGETGARPGGDAGDRTAGNRNGNGALRLEVDRSARELYVHIDGEPVNTYRIAVGREGHETPTGEFSIHQVDWNPDWTPPDSEWAEDEPPRPPGHPENPMGHARLIFQEPYSIHGTDDLESLGRAASHGSIRVANEHVVDLARLVMEHGGASRPESFFQEAMRNRKEMRQVRIPDPIPLLIRP